VAIKAPEGALVALAEGDGFSEPRPTPQMIGMLVAPVYRLEVTRIPGHPGMEVYPTVEVIDRIYPPPGGALKFPIPITITRDELELALAGKYVTRVIYLEDPDRALPYAQPADEESWFEIEPGDDPLAVADRMGRPVAILRIGGRLPGPAGPDAAFLYGSPPAVLFHESAEHVQTPIQEPASAVR
jgi:hypothetical protein